MTNYFVAMLQVLTGRFAKSERGATAVEYGIMVAAIAAVIVAIVFIIGTDVNNAFKTVADKLP